MGEAAAAPPGKTLRDVVLDGAVLVFGLWTVCTHAAIALGGSLRQLLAGFAAAAAVGIAGALALRVRRTGASEPRAAAAEPGDAVAGGIGVAARLLAAAAAAAALVASLGVRSPLPWWWTSVLILGAAALVLMRRHETTASPAEGRGLEAAVWLAGVLCAALAWVIHRPDQDDAFYVNLAVAAVDAPGAPLLVGDSLHGVPGVPLLHPLYRLHAYELWNGALSLLSGLPAIRCFHALSASVAAVAVPLVHARLFRLLVPAHWPWATAALLVVLVSTGDTHQAHANFGLPRIWQGKAILVSVLLPLVSATAIEFARRPTPQRWLLLAAAQVSALGCSSSGIWSAPFAAGVGVLVALRPGAGALRPLAGAALASAYLLVLGLAFRGQVGGEEIPAALTGAQELARALALVLGEGRLLVFSLLVIPLAWTVSPPGRARRFAALAPLAALVLALDPYLAGWLMGHVIGPFFWRASWALPLPVLTALVLVAPLRWERGGPWRWRAATGLSLLAFALFVPASSVLSPENGVRLAVPGGLKVPPEPFALARALVEQAPAGSTVAAPPEVSAWVPTFHGHPHPVEVRRQYLERLRGALGDEDVAWRMLLTDLLSGREVSPARRRLFPAALDRFGVGAVCLRDSSAAERLRVALAGRGFRRHLRAGPYELWVRAEVGTGEERPASHR